eukprot:gene9116-1206_t
MSKKETKGIFNFEDSIDKKVYVRLIGGREIIGILKGYDQTANLVLDESIEFSRDIEDFENRKYVEKKGKLSEEIRSLGIIVCRGINVSYVCPADGYQPLLENPFFVKENK